MGDLITFTVWSLALFLGLIHGAVVLYLWGVKKEGIESARLFHNWIISMVYCLCFFLQTAGAARALNFLRG